MVTSWSWFSKSMGSRDWFFCQQHILIRPCLCKLPMCWTGLGTVHGDVQLWQDCPSCKMGSGHLWGAVGTSRFGCCWQRTIVLLRLILCLTLCTFFPAEVNRILKGPSLKASVLVRKMREKYEHWWVLDAWGGVHLCIPASNYAWKWPELNIGKCLCRSDHEPEDSDEEITVHLLLPYLISVILLVV